MESQDVLVIILLILFWGLSFLVEKLKRKKKAGQRKGFTLRLLELIIGLTRDREREATAQETVLKGHEPEVLVDHFEAEGASVSSQTTSDYRVEDDVWTESTVDTRAQPCEHVVRVVDREVRLPVIPQEKKRGGRKFCRKKMREAVIWAEIIGPPVALQKQE